MRSKRLLSDHDLRLARIFCKIVECGGIAAAEEHLGVARSTISRQLQDFETRLGMVLCKRGRGGFSLTAAGAQAFDYVQSLLSTVDDFATNMAGLSDRVEGKLKIGLLDCTAGDPLNPLNRILKHFQLSLPHVVIDIAIGSPKELEKAVLDEKLHFALIPEYWKSEALDYLPLYREAVGLFAGRDHEASKRLHSGQTLNKAEIQKYPLVYRSIPEPISLQRRKSGFPVGTRALSTEAVFALVISGCYLGFLPTHLAAKLGSDIIELLPREYRYEMSICLTSKNGHIKSAIHKRFLREAKNFVTNYDYRHK